MHINKTAILLWGGINVFISYTYAIYCFAVHFNGLFLVYCFVLGLSFYSFAFFSQTKEYSAIRYLDNIPVRAVGTFLIVIACIFYLIWLKEVIPSIAGNTFPKNLVEYGTLTNPVHVLGLSIFLPALIITAVLLLKKKPLGLLLAPAMLVFCSLMAISISVLIIIMKLKGLEGDLSITIVFGLLALISIVLLIIFLKSINNS